MSILKSLFGEKKDPAKEAIRPLYSKVIAKARQPHWYEKGQVPDTIDGRFEMVAAILCLLLLRLEQEEGQETAQVHLTEIFVDDMDGQLREIGIGDMIVGKHMGQMMAALGGRLGAYREGQEDPSKLRGAIHRNIFREEKVADAALDYLAEHLTAEKGKLEAIVIDDIRAGAADW